MEWLRKALAIAVVALPIATWPQLAAGQWPANGTPICTATGEQGGGDSIGVTKIVSDRTGGAIVT